MMTVKLLLTHSKPLGFFVNEMSMFYNCKFAQCVSAKFGEIP